MNNPLNWDKDKNEYIMNNPLNWDKDKNNINENRY